MCQLVLVLLAVVAGYAGAATIERCCTQKMVGGVNYVLVDTKSTGKWGCHSDCIFERVGMEGSRFCFKSGDLEVVCEDDGFPGVCRCEEFLGECVASPAKNNNCSEFFSPACDPRVAPNCGGCECNQCVFPNSQYTGKPFTIYENIANSTDCQQLCFIDNILSKECNFWNYVPAFVGSIISIPSFCSKFQNVTGIEPAVINGTVRGPIDEYCNSLSN